jgi:WD40 repeat protein
MIITRIYTRVVLTLIVYASPLLAQDEKAQDIALLVPQVGHASFVETVGLSYDGRYVITGGWDGTLRLWDYKTGIELKRLVGEKEPSQKEKARHINLTFGAASPVRNQVLYWQDGASGVIDLDDATKSFDLPLIHISSGTGLFFSSDGERIIECQASYGVYLDVLVYSARNGQQLARYSQEIPQPQGGGELEGCTYSPELDQVFAIVNSTNVSGAYVVAWQLQIQSLGTIYYSPGRLKKITVSKDGRRFFARGKDGRGYLFMAGDNKPEKIWGTYDEKSPASGQTAILGAVFKGGSSELILLSKKIDSVFPSGGYSGKNKLQRWDLEESRLLREAEHGPVYPGAVFSFAKGKLFSVRDNRWVDVWDSNSLEVEKTLRGNPLGAIQKVQISDDASLMMVAYRNDRLLVVDNDLGEVVRTRDLNRSDLRQHLAPNGKYMAVGDVIEDPRSGELISSYDWWYSHAFHGDGEKILVNLYSSRGKGDIGLVESSTGKLLKSFFMPRVDLSEIQHLPPGTLLVNPRNSSNVGIVAGLPGEGVDHSLPPAEYMPLEASVAALSPNEVLVATAAIRNYPGETYDMSVRLWNTESGEMVKRFQREGGWVDKMQFTKDGTKLLVLGHRPELWDIQSGQRIRIYENMKVGGIAEDARFVDNEQSILAAYSNGRIGLFDVTTGELTKIYQGRHTGGASSAIKLNNRNLIVSAGDDAELRFFDSESGDQVLRFMPRSDDDWTAVDKMGRFDSGDQADQSFVWVYKNRVYSLDQLRGLYYEPNLLAKYLGTNDEPLRDVAEFRRPPLLPTVELLEAPEIGDILVKVRDQGDGIGQVVVMLNGREYTNDLRQIDGNVGREVENGLLTLSLNIGDDNRAKGRAKNEIIVRAYDGGDEISSRGEKDVFEGFSSPSLDQEAPKFFALLVGTSDYRGDEIDLKFAAKDAKDFGAALELAASSLFGAENTQVRILSTDYPERHKKPSRANILRELQALKQTKASNVVVVYFAGHGVLRPNSDEYYYLTSTATSTNVGNALAQKDHSISSDEMAQFLREIPADKRVVIMDTCAAAGVIEEFSLSRALPSSQVRALEDLNRRTGFHVLAGSAADKVSYESSRYSQGLLTLSLLQGMKGAALSEGDLVDIVPLFQYSVNQVPKLALGIGGIQKPLYSSPAGGSSFKIGHLKREDKERIVVQDPRPVFVRSNIVHHWTYRDQQYRLSAFTDEVIRTSAEPDKVTGRSSIIFVDTRSFPAAYEITGSYQEYDGAIAVTVRLYEGDAEISQKTVSGTEDEVRAQLVTAVTEMTELVGGL